MAWKKLITEDDFGGFANPSGTIGGAAVHRAATTALRRDAAPALGPLTLLLGRAWRVSPLRAAFGASARVAARPSGQEQ